MVLGAEDAFWHVLTIGNAIRAPTRSNKCEYDANKQTSTKIVTPVYGKASAIEIY